MNPLVRRTAVLVTALLLFSGDAFARGGPAKKPGSFSLSSPGNGSTGVSATPTLTWSDARGETAYLVQVDLSSAFSAPLVSVTNSANVVSYAVPAGRLAAGTKYFWRVIAQNGYGSTSASNAPFSFTTAGAPPPPPPPPTGTSWSRTYGGNSTDFVNGMTSTSDGGTVLAGGSYSFSGAWLVRVRSDASIAWQKAFLFGNLDSYQGGFHGVRQTIDGGIVAAGAGVTGANTTRMASLVRLNSDGSVAWQKGFIAMDTLYALNIARGLETTADGGFVVACTGTGPLGAFDFLLSRFNADGSHGWTRAYGSSGSEPLWSMTRTNDSGYLLAGLAPRQFPPNAAMLVKVSADGTRQWSRIYYGSVSVTFQSVQPTADGGFIACGKYGTGGISAPEDGLVVKLDAAGSIQWQKLYDINYHESLECIRQTADGGYVATGRVASTTSTLFAIKLDATGALVWKKAAQPVFWNANSIYYPALVEAASGGGYRVAASYGTYNTIPADFWLTTLDSNGSCSPLMFDIAVTASSASISAADQSVLTAAVTPLVINTTASVSDTTATVIQKAP